jgi:signal recognition particle subunit SRP54
VKIIHDELVKLLGEGETALSTRKPLTIMLVGLQGGGKTTTAAKLGRLLAKQGYAPLLAACDIYRPAAIDQLEVLAKQENFRLRARSRNPSAPAPRSPCSTPPAGCRSTRP